MNYRKPYRHDGTDSFILGTSPWLARVDKQLNAFYNTALTDEMILSVLQSINYAIGHEPGIRMVGERRDVQDLIAHLVMSELEGILSGDMLEPIPYELQESEVDACDMLITFLLQDLLLTVDESCFCPGLELGLVRRVGDDLLLSYRHPYQPRRPASPQQCALVHRAWNANGYHPALATEEPVHVRNWIS